MSLKDLEYDSEQMVGAARRKSKYPRKILRVVLDDGSCKLQPQLTPDDIKIKDEDWSYYNNYGNNDHQEFDEPITEVIPSTGNYTALPSQLQQHPYENYHNENYTNENYSSENYPNEKYSGENYSSEKYPSEKYPIDKYSGENYSSEKYPNEKYPSEKYSTEKYPTEQYPTEKYPTEKYSSEKYSSEKYPSEKYPNEKYTSENYSHSYNNSHHATNILSTHHPTNELPPTQYMSEDYAGRHHIKNNEQKDHPLKGLSDLRLNDARHDAENRYYDTSQKNDTSTPYMYLNDKPRDMKHIENTSSLLNNRLRATNNNDIKPKDNTRPHKHQHPEPTPDFPYQCDTCDMLFKTIDLLTDHQTTVHHNNRQFACRYCSKRFNDKYNMRKHVLIHVGEKRHRCQFCDKAFLRKDHLRSHLQTHYNRKFGCKVCGKSFRTLDMYQRHAKTHKTSPSLSMANDTPNPDNPYPDLVNLAKLENPIPLTNGSNNRGTVGVKEDSNDSTTNIDNGDSLHISNVTSQYGKDLSPGMTKLESFPVTILDEDFNEFWKNSPSMSENDLSSTNSPVSGDHNHSFVNGDSPKTEGFSCHICNSSFKTDLSLQLHAQKCSGELRNWQCIKCNIIFDEAKTLKQHYEKVHSVEEPIPSPSRWRCKTCNINYPNSKELSRHYAQAHKDAQIFPCSECPKTFTVWHNLKKHMLIHLGDKKHKCTVCEKGFVRKDHLNSHMKVHLGDGSKFTCPICCKVFRLKQMYLKHMNLHGLEQAYDDGGKE